jgi:prevent-host-death family protein
MTKLHFSIPFVIFPLMKFATAKELRVKTRKLLEEAEHGQAIAITFRGKPVAVLVPFEPSYVSAENIRPYALAWADMEATLARTKPPYSSPEEALKISRRRK